MLARASSDRAVVARYHSPTLILLKPCGARLINRRPLCWVAQIKGWRGKSARAFASLLMLSAVRGWFSRDQEVAPELATLCFVAIADDQLRDGRIAQPGK